MILTKPVQITLDFIDAINRNDLDKVTGIMTEDHLFIDLDKEEIYDHKTLVRWWQFYFSHWPEYRICVSELYQHENKVIVIGRTCGSHVEIPVSREYRDTLLWYSEVVDNQIKNWHLHYDTYEARESFGLKQMEPVFEPKVQARTIARHLELLSDGYTKSIREIRKYYTKIWKNAPAEKMLSLGAILLFEYDLRIFSYELVHHHKEAMKAIEPGQVERLGKGMSSWADTDTFAQYIVGPAWKNRRIPDSMLLNWAKSDDVWLRRTALVATIYLKGDVKRMLRFSKMMVGDHEDMIVKALSWVLRKMIKYDRAEVERFLKEHDDILAARVKREVRNKLETGLKTPRKN